MVIENAQVEDLDPFDPMMALEQLTRFSERLASPLHKSHVVAYRQHMYHANVTVNVDAMMAGMVDQPSVYHFGLSALPPIEGYDAVRAHYERRAADLEPNTLNFTVDRLLVDDESLVTEGKLICTGEWAAGHLGLEVDRVAVFTTHYVNVVPFADGAIAGERAYM